MRWKWPFVFWVVYAHEISSQYQARPSHCLYWLYILHNVVIKIAYNFTVQSHLKWMSATTSVYPQLSIFCMVDLGITAHNDTAIRSSRQRIRNHNPILWDSRHILCSSRKDQPETSYSADCWFLWSQLESYLTHWHPLHNINCAHLGTGPLFNFNGILY